MDNSGNKLMELVPQLQRFEKPTFTGRMWRMHTCPNSFADFPITSSCQDRTDG